MTLVRQIEVGIEQGKVKAHLVRKALSDSDANTRGLGYSMISEDHLRELLVEYKPKASDPIACFDYLVECVHLDLDWDEEYALTQKDAFFELASLVDPKRFDHVPDMDVVAFWGEIIEAVRKAGAHEAAKTLAQFEQTEAFAEAMSEWKDANSAVLSCGRRKRSV